MVTVAGPMEAWFVTRYDSMGAWEKDIEAGETNAALQAVRRLFGGVKGGHTGTLDPLATGLLPVCLGAATKFAGVLLETDKTYEALVGLGLATTTGDAEGEVMFRGSVAGCLERLSETLSAFTGEIEQVAHKLAGASASCGITALVGTLRELEQLARSGNLSANRARELYEQARVRYDEVQQFLATCFLEPQKV